MRYENEFLKEISFPIGGIGTGSVGIAGNGRLIDWEIFNKPDKGSILDYSHMAVRLKTKSDTYVKVLNSDIKKDLVGTYCKSKYRGYGYGPASTTMAGFSHFKENTFDGEFPIANLTFFDDDFPGNICLTAFNPFIPLDAYNSSIPAAFFEITYTNVLEEEVELEGVFALANPFDKSRNYKVQKDGITSVKLVNAGMIPDEKDYGDLSLSCEGDAFVQEYWYRGIWYDSVVMYWNEMTSNGLTERTYDTDGSHDTCAIAQTVTLKPGEKKSLRFVVSWNIPNNYKNWDMDDRTKDSDLSDITWKNYYATVFEDSLASGAYAVKNWDMLYSKTLKFKEELFSSTVDDVIKDAVSATMSVLKSPTVYRLENGEFYGFEGVHEQEGSCEGTCQHVWNYAYCLCFLFPELERSIRNLEFEYATDENGRSGFRLMLPLGKRVNEQRACVDGQMGAVIKTYREWKISGDNEWLKKSWPTVKKLLEYAWSEENPDEWDRDKDGVLEGRQHHTLDMELFGPSSWLESFYLAALKAAAEMAEFLGESDKAQEYMNIYEKGKKWSDENLFNGRYFIQKIDLTDKSIVDHFGAADVYWNDESKQIKYQIDCGSAIDQLCGQWHANLCGLGEIFDKNSVHTALENMFKNNYKSSMRKFTNPWRIFALNDESGSVICAYPEGSQKPAIPVPYCEETMHGFEYQFAGLLMSEGYIDQGLTVAKAVRDRYNGSNRNPWNEIECGSNYARSMASFAMLPILSGFTFDLPHGTIGFDPKINKDNFRCIWSLGTGWGNVVIDKSKTVINLNDGYLKLTSVNLPYADNVSSVIADGINIDFSVCDGVVSFREITVEKSLEVLY